MDRTLRIAGIAEESIVDGPGLRLTVFAQGCLRNCPGCQNPQTHDPAGGCDMDCGEILAKIAEDPLLKGVTFSGGEPFLQPAPLVWLAREIHARGLDVMAFSGYTCEELFELGRRNPAAAELLDELDYLVDGPFVEQLKDLELEFRGSSNQRFLKRHDIAMLRKAWLAGAGRS
ncbi:MAG: 4Fe-4S cluster-binding domain-containing protein [Desulfovibrio sp.]|nr:4Fe-4S cluster-binding domain-containing protein [Desulfovibrio sp.]